MYVYVYVWVWVWVWERYVLCGKRRKRLATATDENDPPERYCFLCTHFDNDPPKKQTKPIMDHLQKANDELHTRKITRDQPAETWLGRRKAGSNPNVVVRFEKGKQPFSNPERLEYEYRVLGSTDTHLGPLPGGEAQAAAVPPPAPTASSDVGGGYGRQPADAVVSAFVGALKCTTYQPRLWPFHRPIFRSCTHGTFTTHT